MKYLHGLVYLSGQITTTIFEGRSDAYISVESSHGMDEGYGMYEDSDVQESVASNPSTGAIDETNVPADPKSIDEIGFDDESSKVLEAPEFSAVGKGVFDALCLGINLSDLVKMNAEECEILRSFVCAYYSESLRAFSSNTFSSSVELCKKSGIDDSDSACKAVVELTGLDSKTNAFLEAQRPLLMEDTPGAFFIALVEYLKKDAIERMELDEIHSDTLYRYCALFGNDLNLIAQAQSMPWEDFYVFLKEYLKAKAFLFQLLFRLVHLRLVDPEGFKSIVESADFGMTNAIELMNTISQQNC